MPVDGEKYAEVSRQIYDTLYKFTPDIEPVSIDEAFLDISGTWRLFGTPRETCLLIKSKIKKKTTLTCSVGLAPTKMAAKVASDLNKPDGFVEVSEEGLLDFLWPLDISKMWGLGRKAAAILRKKGINTIGDIAKKDIEDMAAMLGKNGVRFWNLANGIDEREVDTEPEVKSIGNEITFDKDTSDKEKIEGVLMALCERVSSRLRDNGLKGRTVTLKIRLKDFKTYTRTVTAGTPTNFADVLYKKVKNLYNKFDIRNKKVRLRLVRHSKAVDLQIRSISECISLYQLLSRYLLK